MVDLPQPPLSQKPLGYILAVLGGFLGGSVGLVTSPLVLLGLNKLMSGKNGKQPNRFLTWALVGIIGAPASLVASIFINRALGLTTLTEGLNNKHLLPLGERSSSVVPLKKWASVREDRAIFVDGSETPVSITVDNQFMKPVEAKGGKLVVVRVGIANTGKESGNMFWTRFKLKDSNGNTYDSIEDFDEVLTISSWTEARGLSKPGDQLFPGGKAGTVHVFRVAEEATGLTLLVNNKQEFAIN